MGEHPAVPFSPPLIPLDSRRKASPPWPSLARLDHLPSKCLLLATPRVTGLMGSEPGLAACNPSLPAKPAEPRHPWLWGTCLHQQLSAQSQGSGWVVGEGSEPEPDGVSFAAASEAHWFQDLCGQPASAADSGGERRCWTLVGLGSNPSSTAW